MALDINKQLVSHFTNLERIYDILGDTHRSATFGRAAFHVMREKNEISSGKQLMTVAGIGTSVATEVDQYLERGTSDRLEKLKIQLPKSQTTSPNLERSQKQIPNTRSGIIELFQTIDGVGSVTAEKLYNQGYRSIDQLKQHICTVDVNKKQKDGIINYRGSSSDPGEIEVLELFQGVYGIGQVKAKELYRTGYRTIEDLRNSEERFTSAQKMGLIYYEDINKKIPRDEIDKVNIYLTSLFVDSQGTPFFEFEIVGSYRRGESESGDIDILIKIPKDHDLDLSEIVDKLKDDGKIEGKLAQGESKFLGLFRLNNDTPVRRLDLLLISEESYPYAILYFTGSKQFNKLIRTRANQLGLTLNEYQMVSLDEKRIYAAADEEEIFEILGITYLKPEKRTRDLPSLEIYPDYDPSYYELSFQLTPILT